MHAYLLIYPQATVIMNNPMQGNRVVNSRDEEEKAKDGAVAAGASVVLGLRLPGGRRRGQDHGVPVWGAKVQGEAAVKRSK